MKNIIIIALIGLVAGKNEEYKGYKVYNIEVKTEHQQNSISLLKSDMVDFWRQPIYRYGVDGLAMVPPSHFGWFEEKLEELGIAKDVQIEDVYEYLTAAESKMNKITRDDEAEFNFKAYNRYDEILAYLRYLQETYTDTNIQVELVQYGVTEQNRPLVYLKISNTDTVNTEKPVIVIEAGTNPREWITIPAALNVVEEILTNTRYLDDIEWIVVPVLNPDGYEYTHTNLRLWSKSMSLKSHMGFICPGVNINRNFDLDWLHFDSSSSPCSHIFGGIEPFSEIESQMVQNIIQTYGDRIKLFVSLQNNGGFISYPWSYERAASGMFRQHHLLGIEMVRVTEEAYRIDVASTIFDRASGTSADYAKSYDIPYVFNIDIVQRDGVVIPEEDIEGIVDDVWRAIAVAADEVPRINFK